MKRAQSTEQKDQRRKTILDIARDVLSKHDYREIRLQDLADQLGLVKGTFYRYFPTRQDLFMSLYKDELENWLTSWQSIDFPSSADSAFLEKIINDSFSTRALLIRLIGFFPGEVEPELSVDGLRDFKVFMRDFTLRTAETLETKIPSIKGNGVSLLVSIFVLLQGTAPHCFPATRITNLLDTEPEFEIFRFSFPTLFPPLLKAVLKSYFP